MVSYQRVEQRDTGHLFEAPSHDIELREVATRSRDELLSSFDRESLDDDDDNLNDDDTNGSKSSDDRLRSGNEEDDIHRSIRDNAFNNQGSSSSASNHNDSNASNNSQQNSTSSGLTIDSIRNNFNFLDRFFKRNAHREGEIVGQGTENDGVFNNLTAKPDTQPQVDSDKPPTYEEAAADSTPPYWENSVLTPGFGDEIFIDGLPVGNIVNFVWNLLVSTTFQFVGFLLTYILHTSHAAKQGSRAGLGLTFISYGYSMIPSHVSAQSSDSKVSESKVEPNSPNDFNVSGTSKIEGVLDTFHSTLSDGVDAVAEKTGSNSMIYLAYAVILFGVFIVIKAILNYNRARKMEEIILQPPVNFTPPEELV